MKIIYALLVLVLLSSCVSKTTCSIVPINSAVLDSIQMKGDFVFKNQLGEKDTLILIDQYNVLQNQTKKSLMTYEKCGHYIGFNYDSSNKKGTVNIGLFKNENDQYVMSVNGFCLSKDITLNQTQAEKDSVITIDVKKCAESKFKTIALRKCKIQYFITQDNVKWEPVQFIPK